APDTRAVIARGLSLLGGACVSLGETSRGEEVLRLAVQYAGDGPAAGDAFFRLGEALLRDDRPGEAIAPLRRAANLGVPGERVWPLLARAFCERRRWVAAFAAALEGRAAGVPEEAFASVLEQVEAGLGPALALAQQALANRPGSEIPGSST